jgi:phage terminase large subunit GpA-like protein
MEVYEFCRQPHPVVIMPSKGQGRMGKLYDPSKIDVYPGTSKIIPGGVWLLNINVQQYKDALDGKLKVSTADPGAWRLCADCDDDWARQMTAEVVDEKTGLWINPKNRANHAWDCSVLNLVAADFRKIRFRPRPEPKQKTPAGTPIEALPSQPAWISRGSGPARSWIGRR